MLNIFRAADPVRVDPSEVLVVQAFGSPCDTLDGEYVPGDDMANVSNGTLNCAKPGPMLNKFLLIVPFHILMLNNSPLAAPMT